MDTTATAGVGRDDLLRQAQRLGVFTVAWNVVECAVAVVAAWISRSRAMAGFGLDSAVESLSATVLLWRLGAERRDPHRVEHVERIATRAIASSFVVLGSVVAFESIRSLVRHEKPSASPIGIVLTIVSLMVMPLLARRKRRVAVALRSRAAEADSAQTKACAYLSVVVLVGLVLNAAFGWWWADPVAALGVVAVLLNEGRQAFKAEHVDDCC